MMLNFIFLYMFAIVILLGVAADGVETFWFRQVFDHYSDDDDTTYWNQRYLVNKKAWKNEKNSPVFLMISGHCEASNKSLTEGAWVQWATKYGALLVQLEHRYYGQSRPTKDVSLDNLEVLRSFQSVRDASTVIKHVNEKYNLKETNKWIMFGCGYSGNLAVWTRYLMGSQVYAAVSSGAPLIAKYDFHEYWDVATKALESESPNCAENFRSALTIIPYFREDVLMKEFNICDNFNSDSKRDMIRLYIKLGELVEPAVEYNGQSPGPNNIKYICNKFLNNDTYDDDFQRLRALVRDRYKKCIDVSHEEFLKTYNNTSWNHPVNNRGFRPWLWQTCIEFGQYRNSESEDSLLLDGIPLRYFRHVCQTLFDIDENKERENVALTNVLYEATSLNVTRVVFVQGTLDPWSRLGMISFPTNSSPLVKIEGGSHCQDFLTPKDSDPAEVKKARKTIDSYLTKWLK